MARELLFLSMSMGMKLCAKFGRSRTPRMAVGGGGQGRSKCAPEIASRTPKMDSCQSGQLGRGHLGSSSP